LIQKEEERTRGKVLKLPLLVRGEKRRDRKILSYLEREEDLKKHEYQRSNLEL